MKLTHAIAFAGCVLSSLFVSSVARAEDTWDIDLTLGTNVAAPTSTAPSFVGPRFGLGLRYFVAENHALGLAIRAHLLVGDDTQEDLNASLSWRYIGRPDESVRLLFGFSAGAGWWPECVHMSSPDACGGVGGAVGIEAGMQIPVSEDAAITFGAEFVGRVGASDIKGMVMMPGGWAGVSF